LFYLRREREETAAGLPPRSALQRAAATSGQAVLISGATVVIAMAGMLLAGNAAFTSLGVGVDLVARSIEARTSSGDVDVRSG
jgi:putative drug exporter of the RND superfamily